MVHVKGIIFDMDGTLIDSEVVYYEAMNKVAKDLHIPFTKQHYYQILGLSNDEFYQICHEWFDDVVGTEEVNRFTQKSSEYLYELLHAGYAPLKPGAIEILDYCEQHQIKLTLASNSGKDLVDLLLEKANIAHYFDRTFSVDDVKNGKPDPEIHLAALAYLGIEKEQALVIEDSLTGIKAANAAGIPVIMVPDLIPAPDDVELVAVASSLFEVINELEKE